MDQNWLKKPSVEQNNHSFLKWLGRGIDDLRKEPLPRPPNIFVFVYKLSANQLMISKNADINQHNLRYHLSGTKMQLQKVDLCLSRGHLLKICKNGGFFDPPCPPLRMDVICVCPPRRKRRWMEAAAMATEAAGGGGGRSRGNRLFYNAAKARKLNGEQGRMADSFEIAKCAVQGDHGGLTLDFVDFN